MDLEGALKTAPECKVVLIDCLTLWVNNLMYGAQQSGQELTEEALAARCQAVLSACAAHRGLVILVTNEVGGGIVPENALARRFRDLAGRCNQTIAAGADEVTLLVCGQPLRLKKQKESTHEST